MNKKIERYIDLLKQYNEKTNIYSKKAYDKLEFHINDSLQLSALLPNSKLTIFDFGSGSGLPSIPLSINNLQHIIYAIESKQRKTDFLNHVKTTLELNNLKIINNNLFEWKAPCSPDIITAKAFAPIEKIKRLYNRFKGESTICYIPISENQATILKKDPNISIIQETHFFYAKLS